MKLLEIGISSLNLHPEILLEHCSYFFFIIAIENLKEGKEEILVEKIIERKCKLKSSYKKIVNIGEFEIYKHD